MLNALKSIYTMTSCILNLNGKFFTTFSTSCGIRQGAPSSSWLFIVFIKNVIDHIRHRCVSEPLIEITHVLLHADDTLILSTDRSLFIKKCNSMLKYFEENKLKLNLGKSGYLIIHGKNIDIKSPIYLDNGLLNYKSEIVSLRLIFSDPGKIGNDIKLNIQSKRSNITVNISISVRRTIWHPLTSNTVLHSCVMTSHFYGSETWGENLSNDLETMYRMGLKTALSVRVTTCNEIVHIESCTYPAACMIKKLQLKFWISLILALDYNSSLSKLLQKANNIITSYIIH